MQAGFPNAFRRLAEEIGPVDAVGIEERVAKYATRSIKKASKVAGLKLAVSMVDLTTLEGKDTPDKVASLCRKALNPHPGLGAPQVAAVCVYPSMVKHARRALGQDTAVRIASVATAFPSGQAPLRTRLAEVKAAVADGADEIDMVINRGAFLSGRFDTVVDEIVRTRQACGPAHLKIILETGELETLDNIRRASDLAIHAASLAGPIRDGEVFIKTSTGKVQPAATMPVTLVMLEAIRDHFLRHGVRIGMKPAGGIRAAKESLHYLVMVKETLGEAWLTPDLFRFGASALANDLLRQIVRLERGVYMASTDFSEA